MLRRLYLVFASMALLCAPLISFSQTMVNRGLPEHAIVFGGFDQSGPILHLNYEIPFPGVVTLVLLDKSGRKVWHKQAPLEDGPNRFSMKKAAFDAGESYSFLLQYKLSEVTGPVPAP
jgi:hypothetical protein